MNHSDGKIKHYVKNADELALLENDIISFGFNICSVYDRGERNLFMYRLVKKPIVTIALDDSDDDEDDAPKPVVQVGETIELDSGSDDSSDEYLENMDDGDLYCSTSSDMGETDSDDDSLGSDGSDSFVVCISLFVRNKSIGLLANSCLAFTSSQITKTILNPPTPQNGVPFTVDDDDDDSNGTANRQAEDVTSSTDDVDELAAQDARIEKVKRALAEKAPKRVIITAPLPLLTRKRRTTMTEADYAVKKQKSATLSAVDKNRRADKLRQIEENKRVAREANGECSNEPERKAFTPKVKNTTVSRSSLLSSDMLSADQE